MHSWHKIAPGSLEEVGTDIFTVGGFLYQKFETISLKCAQRSLWEFRPIRFYVKVEPNDAHLSKVAIIKVIYMYMCVVFVIV